MAKDQLNGLTIPNGTRPSTDGSRPIHDGFATIRSSGIKRNRTARSVQPVPSDQKTKPCSACCVPTMEPLWEERNGNIPVNQPAVVRRDPKIPWWEVATRRSRYRSCPAFSQASIVSALEQTVSDVTDRLERLASSPDLKAAEIEELRKSAAALRRQSSAVSQSVSSGYFSLERQASCDSVSSVSSSLSNATHVSYNSMASRQTNHTCSNDPKLENFPEESKQKKKNWLRASFRRAFGKQNRKRPKVEENIEPPHIQTLPRSGANRYFSCTSLHRKLSHAEQNDNRLFISNRKDSDIVSRLQQVLIEKERLLADARVEIMNSQLQLQKQSETINKLQVEAVSLKEENQRLSNIVQSKYGTIGDSVVPVVQNFNNFNINNSTGQYATLRSIQGSKMQLYVYENTNLSSPFDVAKVDKTEVANNLVGSVSILPKTTWEQLDTLVSDKFQDYCMRYDPGNGLGLGHDSIYCYQLAEAVRAEGLPKPDLLPYGYCVGEIEAIHLWLKGPLQKDDNKYGDLSSVSLRSGIPHSVLKQFMNAIAETKRLLIVGAKSTGKSFLAQTIARNYAAGNATSNSIVTFKMDKDNDNDLCSRISSMVSRISRYPSVDSPVPEILIIEDIHKSSGILEKLQRCLPLSQSKLIVIATAENVPSLVTRMQVHCSFRFIGLSLQEEPVLGLLGRVLRRPLLETEEATGVNLPCVHRTIDWITRLWMHLNSILSQAGIDDTVGPTIFCECPLDQEKARMWFTSKWNDCIVPLIISMVKDGITGTWVDPKDWISTTYPWTGNASGLTQLLNISTPGKKSKVSPSLRLAFPTEQNNSTVQDSKSEIYSIPCTRNSTYDTLSIYRKPRIDPEIFNQCKMETFTPLSYRKEYKPIGFHKEVTLTTKQAT